MLPHGVLNIGSELEEDLGDDDDDDGEEVCAGEGLNNIKSQLQVRR